MVCPTCGAAEHRQRERGGDCPTCGADLAVSWLIRLRTLQSDGLPFDDALVVANREFPDG